MKTVKELQSLIEEGIRSESLFKQREPDSLYEPIRYILALGGKRMRPLLTLMAAQLFQDEVDELLPAALALEVFHNFTLLHDDIMDRAPLRRNQATVHEKWNANVAILSGDAMCIAAYALMARMPATILPQLLELFNQTALEVCEGQQLDMEFEARPEVSTNEYLRMIRLKTAVLPAACLRTGAIAAGASEADASLLYEMGIQVGMAFQLQDDLLDVFGDQAVFGKTIGGDIIANKKTFLLTRAFELAGLEQREQLESSMRLNQPDQKIERISALYRQLGLPEKTKSLQAEYYSRGMEALDKVSVQADLKKPLLDFLSQLYHRSS